MQFYSDESIAMTAVLGSPDACMIDISSQAVIILYMGQLLSNSLYSDELLQTEFETVLIVASYR